MITAVFALLPLQPPIDDFEALWADCRRAVETRYYARNSRRDEMIRLLDEFEPQAKAAKTRKEFGHVMKRMTAKFGDSHFDFLTNHEQGFYLMDGFRGEAAEKFPHVGAWFKNSNDGYTVTMVLQGSPSWNAKLRKGDVVIRIDGDPFEPIDALRPRISTEATVEFVRDSSPNKTTLRVEESKGFQMFLEATKRSARIIEHNGKRIGYMHIWLMASRAFRDELSAFLKGAAKDTDGFILDIRDGFGGRPEGYVELFDPDRDDSYKKPLVVIINEGSRSAKEVFAYRIKKSERATLVGSRTAGHVLATTPFKIREWAYFEIPIIEFKIDGISLEGRGVEPHLKLDREMGPNGEDLFLAKSLEFLAGPSLNTTLQLIAGASH